MKLATTILQLLASILLFSKTLTPTSPYLQHSCLGRLLDSSWHLPIPVPLVDLPLMDIPFLRSSTITATANVGLPSCNATSNSLNNSHPHPIEVSNDILPVVTLGNTSTLNINYTLLHYVTVLHALSNATMPVAFASFGYVSFNDYNQHSYLQAINNLNIILAVLFSILVPFLFVLQKFIKFFPQDNCDGSIGNVVLILPTVSDSCQTYDNYSFLYGIDDEDDISFMSFEADDDSIIYSVSVHLNVDDSSTVFSNSSLAFSGLAVFENSTTRFFIDDNNDDLSSDLSLTFSATTVMHADDEENLDDDSLCYSVSTCADLFIASDCQVILPADVEFALPKMRRSPRIAAMPSVSYKKFY